MQHRLGACEARITAHESLRLADRMTTAELSTQNLMHQLQEKAKGSEVKRRSITIYKGFSDIGKFNGEIEDYDNWKHTVKTFLNNEDENFEDMI